MVNITCYDDEFPLLEGNGLYAVQTQGEGNCLFAALSDQIYGHENNHHELRQRVVEHLRTHADYFKVFIDVAPVRRAPKRKAASGAKNKSVADITTHSESEIDQAFEHRLNQMQQSGVFGDNLEVQAFAREFNVDVKIYQREYAYVIRGGMDGVSEDGGDEGRQVVHIAYHLYEHYSSVRNREGPHSGPADVTPRPATPNTAQAAQKKLSTTSVIMPWMVEAVFSSLPYVEAPERIRELLEKYKGDVNMVVSVLIDDWDEHAETPSSDKDVAPVDPSTPAQQSPEDETIIVKYTPPSPSPSQSSKRDSEDDISDGGNYKRRKSPAGTPVNTTPKKEPQIKQESDAEEGRDRRRKAPTPPKAPLRRSQRILAKSSKESPAGSDTDNKSAVTEERQDIPPPRDAGSGPKSRKQKRQGAKAKRKTPSSSSTKKSKDAVLEKGTAQITTGIRELYV